MSIPYMRDVHIRVFSDEFPKYDERKVEMRKAYVMWTCTDNCMLELVSKDSKHEGREGQPQLYHSNNTDWSYR